MTSKIIKADRQAGSACAALHGPGERFWILESRVNAGVSALVPAALIAPQDGDYTVIGCDLPIVAVLDVAELGRHAAQFNPASWGIEGAHARTLATDRAQMSGRFADQLNQRCSLKPVAEFDRPGAEVLEALGELDDRSVVGDLLICGVGVDPAAGPAGAAAKVLVRFLEVLVHVGEEVVTELFCHAAQSRGTPANFEGVFA